MNEISTFLERNRTDPPRSSFFFFSSNMATRRGWSPQKDIRSGILILGLPPCRAIHTCYRSLLFRDTLYHWTTLTSAATCPLSLSFPPWGDFISPETANNAIKWWRGPAHVRSKRKLDYTTSPCYGITVVEYCFTVLLLLMLHFFNPMKLCFSACLKCLMV